MYKTSQKANRSSIKNPVFLAEIQEKLKIYVVYIISIFHVCMVWIEKSVTRVTDRHHEACRVMPNSDPE